MAVANMVESVLGGGGRERTRGRSPRSHRARLAVVYLRQSTLLQVREHTESTRAAVRAGATRRSGWAGPARTCWSSMPTWGCRAGSAPSADGFRDVVAKVCLGEVGAIFGLEVSRLARSSADFARLLELARLTDTLLIDGDGVYDLADFNDRLLLGLKGSMSEAELHLLAGRLHGREAGRGDARRAARLRCRSGYVYDDDGRVVIDPDEEVAGRGRATCSPRSPPPARPTRWSPRSPAGRFPLRAYGGVWAGQLRWGKLTHARVLGVLNNPCLRRDVCLRPQHRPRRRVQPDGTVRTTGSAGCRARSGRWSSTITTRATSPGSDFLDNRGETRRPTAPTTGARPPREGTALCQGIIGCGSCGRPMSTRYQRKRPGRLRLLGHRARPRGHHRPAARSRAATVDDAVVAELLLATLTPGQIASALAAADEVTDRHTRSAPGRRARRRARPLRGRPRRAGLHARSSRKTAWSPAPWRPAGRPNSPRSPRRRPPWTTAREARRRCPDRAALQALAADLPRLWDDPDTSDRGPQTPAAHPDRRRHPAARDRPRPGRIGVRWHTGATDDDHRPLTRRAASHPGRRDRTDHPARPLA